MAQAEKPEYEKHHNSVQRIMSASSKTIIGWINALCPRNHYKLKEGNEKKMKTLKIFAIYEELNIWWTENKIYEKEQADHDKLTLLLFLNLMYFSHQPAKQAKMGHNLNVRQAHVPANAHAAHHAGPHAAHYAGPHAAHHAGSHAAHHAGPHAAPNAAAPGRGGGPG